MTSQDCQPLKNMVVGRDSETRSEPAVQFSGSPQMAYFKPLLSSFGKVLQFANFVANWQS